MPLNNTTTWRYSKYTVATSPQIDYSSMTIDFYVDYIRTTIPFEFSLNEYINHTVVKNYLTSPKDDDTFVLGVF